MANNPFQTPASPWTLVHSNGLLFNTSTRTTRLTTQWASPSNAAFTALKNNWASTSISQSLTGFGYALKYLATGVSSNATTAYTNALSEPAAGSQFETDSARAWSQSVPYVYAWCNGALTSTQNNDLLTRIESNQVSLEANIGNLGKFLIDGCGNGNVGMPGYIMNWCAADGQRGNGIITDRTQNVTNLVQNMVLYINQQYNEGVWTSYDNLLDLNMIAIIAFHCATGNESLLATRCPAILGRGEILARMLESSGNNLYSIIPNNARRDLTGKFIASWPTNAWSASMYSDITSDATMAWVRDQQLANCTPNQWSHLGLQSEPTWLGFFFYNSGVTGVSPANTPIATCKSFQNTGVAQFRSGWGASDVVAGFGAGPVAMNDHAIPFAGFFWVRVGSTWLIADGYNYGHRASTWEEGVPAGSGEVGAYTMRHSCPSFSPSATESTRVDRDGSASVVQTTGSSTAYPLSYNLTNNVRQTWLGGSLGTMFDNGTLAKVTADISQAFPQVTKATRTVGYHRPASGTLPATFVIYDQFTAPATINQIRANFWSKFKPTFVSETILQGTTSAGVTQWGGDHVVIKSGSYQATIQCVSTFNTINGVGGAGYESFFDAPANATTGYATSGGANLDFVANGGGDSRNPTEFLWMNNNASVPGQIQWRTSFQTTQATSAGTMLFVITVDNAGTTAPSYNQASALQLLSTSGVAVPGFSQLAQRQALDWLSGRADAGLPTLYAALFTTLPADDGTGGTEVSGNGYARQLLTTSTFGAASGGSPATCTNASTISWTSTGSWGTIVGVGFYDALTNGNYRGSDFLGTGAWMPFTCTSASPGVLTSTAHGLSNGNLVQVTAKYGGTLPATGGSWGGALTVANATTDTFTAGVNTTGTGDGMVRQVLTQAVSAASTVTLAIGAVTLSLG